MPAAVGATITGASLPLRHSNLGPFKSSGGAFYAVVRSSLTAIQVYKATDPTAAFAAAGATQTTATAEWTTISCVQVGDVIHVVATDPNGDIYYQNFNTASDTWAAASMERITTFVTIASSTPLCSVVARSTGEWGKERVICCSSIDKSRLTGQG